MTDQELEIDPVEFFIDDSLVILEGEEHEVDISDMHLFYREGVWCEKYDGEWMPDWCLTWFYDDQDNPADYIFFEQDPPETAIHNLRHILNEHTKSVRSIEN